jgi:mannose-1-phosphate guanylyltransferase
MSSDTLEFAPSTYALILAGGSGTRFWPLSRNEHPKQLLKLFNDETLLEKAVKRLDGLVPPERILILTNPVQLDATRAALPDFPSENIIAEPERRDTAPAIALAVGWVAARDPEATMVVLPADQLVNDHDKFRAILVAAAQAARAADAVVTIGIKPTWPCPSYGYIERGLRATISALPDDCDASFYEVVRFREKPSPQLAEEFIEQGNFAWNAGIFIWTVPVVLREFTEHCPEIADFVHELRKATDLNATVASQFADLPKISIDYALMEKARRILNIEANFDWDDVGSWISIGKYFDNDNNGNTANQAFSQIESHNNIVFAADKNVRVCLLGVNDLIVVQTHDAILVADKDEADTIKRLVAEVPDNLL